MGSLRSVPACANCKVSHWHWGVPPVPATDQLTMKMDNDKYGVITIPVTRDLAIEVESTDMSEAKHGPTRQL